MSRFAWIVVTICVVTGTVNAQQGSVEERLQRLEAENARIQRELEETQARNIKLEVEVGTLRVETEELREGQTEGEFASDLEQRINSLAEYARDASWSTATKSGLPIRFYGFIRMDAYYDDSKAALDPVLVFAVLPEDDPAVEDDDDAFTAETRLVRFGFDIDAGEIAGADVTAKLETDFANFILARESRSTPRTRLAYIDLAWEEFSLRFGQDWDVISPLYPQVHNELLLWGAGNLGDRRPQIQFTWAPKSSGSVSFLLELSIAPSGAVDGVDNDGSPNNFLQLDGYDAGHPHGQVRLSISFDTHVDEARGTVGVWGYIAGIETDTEFNGTDHFTPWVVGIDVNVPLASILTLRFEAWYGQALSDVRGNILQSINPIAGDEIRGYGGWGEFRVQATDDFLVVAGASIDNPHNDDLAPGQRSLNWTVYLGTKYDFGGGLSMGVDLIYWRTDWKDVGEGDLIRVASYIQLVF